ncbi:hypothetical protein ACIQMZ_37285 [Streptomyces longwoodensis]|uniref:hypothetical protein n=1 Tax=Streptomyces longwoodensis TaxID=68231 RepID=UPI00382186DB
MSAGGTQISSLHLAVAAAGGLLLYAALRGVSPVQALKDVASGAPPAVSTEGKTIKGADGSVDPDYVPGGYGSTPWKGVYRKAKTPKALQRPSAFIAAAGAHAGEKYSQGDRWGKHSSDCASFVGKALLDVGIDPPGGSVTGDYLTSGQWVTVTTPRAGDVAVNGRHMIIFTDGTHGIGQQNPRRNVQRDTVDNLMANTGAWQIRRYRGWA